VRRDRPVVSLKISPNRELGAAYDDAMKQRIFEPLAMTRTTFDFETALASNHASTHSMTPDGVVRVSTLNLGCRDLLRFLRGLDRHHRITRAKAAVHRHKRARRSLAAPSWFRVDLRYEARPGPSALLYNASNRLHAFSAWGSL
jgi:CubicO group peptidase (beta-lactamase class C family)